MLRNSSERVLRQALLFACRGFSTTGAIADSGAGRFPNWLGGSQRRVTVPLTQPLPGLAAAGYDVPPSVPVTEVTTLSNGVRIVSEASTVRHRRDRQSAMLLMQAFTSVMCRVH
jgi:hypothetical protein